MAKLAVSAIVAASLLSLKANNAFARNAADSLLATPNITSLSAYQRSESVKKASDTLLLQLKNGWEEANKKFQNSLGESKLPGSITVKSLTALQYQNELEADKWVYSYPAYVKGKAFPRPIFSFNENWIKIMYLEGFLPPKETVHQISAFVLLELSFEKTGAVPASFFPCESLSLLYSSFGSPKSGRPITKGELIAAFTSFIIGDGDPVKILSIYCTAPSSLPDAIDSSLGKGSFKSIMDAKNMGEDVLQALLVQIDNCGKLSPESLKKFAVFLEGFGVETPSSLLEK
jgi:hypothetical protein